MNKVLLTGASGFVGQHLVSTLLPRTLRLAMHRASNAAIEQCELTIVGDINQQTGWEDALSNVSCVVHMAGSVHVMNPTSNDHRKFYETNVLGTERLAQVAAERGIKRFIFLSSIKVNGEATFGSPYTADDVGAPVDEYGKSKWQAEQRLLNIAQSSEMELIVIRPPLVYGSGVRANFLRLLSWVHRGIPLPLGSVRNSRSLVSVWNLCDLIKRAIDEPIVESGIYLVSDDDDLSTPELIQRLAYAMGRPARLLSVPESFLKFAGAITGKSAEIARLSGSLAVDIASTKRRLRWSPPLTVVQSLERTAQWYLSEVSKRRD